MIKIYTKFGLAFLAFIFVLLSSVNIYASTFIPLPTSVFPQSVTLSPAPTKSQDRSDIVTSLSSINKTLNDKLVTQEDWASWAAVVVALILGIAGIVSVQDWVKGKFVRPVLKIRIKPEPPDCLKIALRNVQTGQFSNDAYYFRFRVENAGNYQMQDVEAVAVELEKRNRNNRYSIVKSFLPMNLTWADLPGHVTIPKIQPGLFKYCDLGHVIESAHANLHQFGITATSQVVFIVDTQVTPNTGSNILLPGDYRIKIIFAANNLKPQPMWFRLNIRNNWTTDEEQMLSRNISVKRIRV